MPAADHIRLFERIVAAVNANDMPAVASMLAPGFVRHDLAGVFDEVVGGQGVADFLSELRRSLPDMQVHIEDIFATDERLALRITVEGTHTGEPFLGTKPRGNRVSFAAINLYRLENGLPVESWQLWDWAGAIKQMQAKPSSQPAT